MATVTAAPLHPRSATFTVEARSLERRIGLLFAVSGVALIALMGVLGLIMRLTQAGAIDLSPGWFYRLMTLHGGGMITGALLAAMGCTWYVLRAVVPLRPGRMLWAYGLMVGGALVVLVSTLVGGFAAAWTFLPPLPFYPTGLWSTWAEILFFAGMMAISTGFYVFCLDVLTQATRSYGGLGGATGWRFLRGRDATPPPPQVIAATVVAIDGALAMTAGAAITLGLLNRTYDTGVGFDYLVAKNLVYFFGHTIANLVIYLVAASVYVILPRYAGRPYEVTKVFVGGWLAAWVLIVTVYSHHLYMDFVQPRWVEIVSTISSYASALPVAVITIFSMTMLVWGSAYRWTLASSLLYVGLAGWAIGGTGAVIDSIIPINFRFHNTDWVVAHFHTYLMLTVVVWLLAFIAHLLERDAGRTSSPVARVVAIGLMLFGGFGFTGTWFVAGALGVPRRYALQPPGTSGYSVAGSVFAFIFALGFLACVAQLVPLAREAWRRRHFVEVRHRDTWTGGEYTAHVRRDAEVDDGPPEPTAAMRPPIDGPWQIAFAAAACVVALSAYFPQVIDASEASIRYHHLDHAGQYFLGTMLGLLLGSYGVVARRLGDHPGVGLAAVVVVPVVMMLLMVPRLYEPLEKHSAAHAGYHLAMGVLGVLTGLGASRLGAVTGRLSAFLAVAMALMFAAAMTGG
jgi:cytochrome c oxidase subunit 1